MPQFQVIAFDGLRGLGDYQQGATAMLREVPRGGNPSRYVLFDSDPNVITAQQAETAYAPWWGTRKMGVFGSLREPSNRMAGMIVCGIAAATVLAVFVGTWYLKGRA